MRTTSLCFLVLCLGFQIPAQGTSFPWLRSYANPVTNTDLWAVELMPDLDNDGVPDLLVSGGDFVATVSAKSGTVLRQKVGTLRFGVDIAVMGDVNNDGVVDFAVPTRDWGPVPYQRNTGQVEMYSGKDWSVLWTVRGPNWHTRFGSRVDKVDDVDSDGVSDLFVYSSSWSVSDNKGRLDLLSGRTGARIWFLSPLSRGDEFGRGVGYGHDVNGDGKRDVLVSSRTGVHIYDLATSRFIRTVPLSGGAANVEFIGDVNGDKTADYAIGWAAGYFAIGSVEVRSGLDDSVIHKWVYGYSPAGTGWGRILHAPGDLNADGVPDLFVSGTGADGILRVFSGKDFSILAAYSGASSNSALARGVNSRDVTGDGVPELLLCSRENGGTVHILQVGGASRFGVGSAGTGGVVPQLRQIGFPSVGNSSFAMEVASGVRNAPFAIYLAGTSQRLATQGVEICVSLPLWGEVIGVLDAQGRGSVPLGIPNLPSLHGVSVVAQAAVVDASGSLCGQSCFSTTACVGLVLN